MRLMAVTLLLLMASDDAGAGPADVVDAVASAEQVGTWRFDVTVRHADAGWEHYADRWEVVNPADGTILGT